MRRPPPRPTRTDTRFPDTTLFRSAHADESRLVADAGVVAQRLRELDAPGAVEGQLLGFGENGGGEVVVGLGEQRNVLHPRIELLHEVHAAALDGIGRSEEHTSELQSLMRNSYAVFCLKKKKQNTMDINTRESEH